MWLKVLSGSDPEMAAQSAEDVKQAIQTLAEIVKKGQNGKPNTTKSVEAKDSEGKRITGQYWQENENANLQNDLVFVFVPETLTSFAHDGRDSNHRLYFPGTSNTEFRSARIVAVSSPVRCLQAVWSSLDKG